MTKKKQDEDGGVGEELCTGGVVAKSRKEGMNTCILIQLRKRFHV